MYMWQGSYKQRLRQMAVRNLELFGHHSTPWSPEFLSNQQVPPFLPITELKSHETPTLIIHGYTHNHTYIPVSTIRDTWPPLYTQFNITLLVKQ